MTKTIRIKLVQAANVQVASEPGKAQVYAGEVGEILEVPEDVAGILVQGGLGVPMTAKAERAVAAAAETAVADAGVKETPASRRSIKG